MKSILSRMADKNFWNNWDLKTIITILTVIVTVSFYFAKIETTMNLNYELLRAEIKHIQDIQESNRRFLQMQIEDLKRE